MIKDYIALGLKPGCTEEELDKVWKENKGYTHLYSFSEPYSKVNNDFLKEKMHLRNFQYLGKSPENGKWVNELKDNNEFGFHKFDIWVKKEDLGKERYNGKTNVKLKIECPYCEGKKIIMGGEKCPKCDGAGGFKKIYQDVSYWQRCIYCEGYGGKHDTEVTCPVCHGTGTAKITRKVNPFIPFNAKPGDRICIWRPFTFKYIDIYDYEYEIEISPTLVGTVKIKKE